MEHTRQQGKDRSDVVEHKRRRRRRNTRRAYIRSIYLLPSMATLGNAICGFAAIYIAGLTAGSNDAYPSDPVTQMFMRDRFVWAAYLIFAAMVFDGLDGRLARFTRHTTDFGGQLDSMADVISFGVAPAILMLQVAKSVIEFMPDTPFFVTRAIWAAGAVYASCAAIRLARFNVSNQHGEQHHFSFLGLPSPGAAGVMAAMALMYVSLQQQYSRMNEAMEYGLLSRVVYWTGTFTFWSLPVITFIVGLLMVSKIRYPHLVNRYLKGKKTVGQLVLLLIIGGLALAFYKYAIAVGMLAYTLWGLLGFVMARVHKGSAAPVKVAAASAPTQQ